MSYYTCDTSVVISRKLSDLPDSFLFSGVVLLELLAHAKDESERKRYEAVHRAYSKDNSLITPNVDDWLLASKVLYWLVQERRRRSGGKLPRICRATRVTIGTCPARKLRANSTSTESGMKIGGRYMM